jgi:hypothetical protein
MTENREMFTILIQRDSLLMIGAIKDNRDGLQPLWHMRVSRHELRQRRGLEKF